MLQKLLRSKVLGIVLCLGIAAAAVIAALRNGDEGSRRRADSGSWEVTTDMPEENLELPELEVNTPADLAAPDKSRRASLDPRAERPSSTTEPTSPSRLSRPVPGAGGVEAPSGGSQVPSGGGEAPAREDPQRNNSAEAHPDGLTFTRDEVVIAIDPGGDGGQNSDTDEDDEETEDKEEDEAK